MNDNTTFAPLLGEKNRREQVLKDFIATAQKNNYDYDLVLSKFPELVGYDLQILKDYIATAEANNYDYAVVNVKFPELFELKKKDEPTESISEDGFSEPSEAAPSALPRDLSQNPFSEEESVALAQGLEEGLTTRDPRLVEQNLEIDKIAATIAKAEPRKLEDAVMGQRDININEAEQLKIDESRTAALSTPEVDNLITQVNPDLIALEEDEVVEKMRTLFKGRGFTFETLGLGVDRMRVRTTDGLHSIDIELDNFTNATDVAESSALQAFLRTHFNPTLLSENEDEISKAIRAQQMRGTQERWNEDGTASTVKFMSYEEDGVHKVAPTLFPRSTTRSSSPRAEDWLELGMEASIQEAERRGEVITFDSQEEAEAFAEGSWKTMNSGEVEAQKFFNERGRDYISDRNAYDNYRSAQEERIFLEEQIEIQEDNRWDDAGQYDDLTDEEEAAYGHHFREDGSLRGDAAAIVESLDKEEGNLWGIVNNDDYRRAQEDLDVRLEGLHREQAQRAANLNYEAKYIEKGLEIQSLEAFGIGLDQLNTYQPKTEQERVNLNEMIALQNSIQTKKETAALRYETALTYYDEKSNKEATLEYLDNLKGWSVATDDGYKNGRAAQQLLYLSMGIYDVEDEAQLELAATRMTGYMNSVDGRQSRALSRFNSAEDGWNREVRGALRRDPIETIMTWAGASLSQILPYGAKIIPSFTGAGAGTGALAGLASGPWAPITSSAGALTGGVWGLRAGFAATNLVLEYTNGILDAGRELGFNMHDPQEAMAALQSDEVWARGKERGLKRGIPIALMDVIGAGLAGKVIKGVSTASRLRKAAAFATERVALDAPIEATGELLAQITVGDELSFKEILAEAGGSIGNQTTVAAVNIYAATRGGYNQRIAASLMDTKLMASERASDNQIQTWTNNMLKLGKITPEQSQRILENVGLRREANDLLSVSGPSRVGVGKAQRQRVMELLNIREGLESSSNRKSVFSPQIARINAELAEISQTGNLSESPVDLNTFNTLGGTRSQVPSYRIGNVSYSKADFLDYIENLTPRRAAKILKDSNIINDEETSILLTEKLKPFDTEESTETTDNAIQEPSTTEVDVQQPTTDSEEVGTGDVVEETTDTAEAQDQVAPTAEEEKDLEIVDRGTRADIEAFRNETIEPERKNALLAGIAQRMNEGKKLTKFQQEMADVNAFEIAEMQDVVAEQDAVTQEAVDFEESLAEDESFNPRVVQETTKPEDLVYTGAFVNDTKSLAEQYPSTLPNKHGGHMTVAYKPDFLDVTTGEKVSLKVIGRLTTDKVDVLILENEKSTKETPHITLATAEGVSPSAANQEIKDNQDKIVPLNETVEATYGYFDSKKGNVVSLQDDVQNEGRTTSGTKRKSVGPRTGGTGATSKVSRYDVRDSDRVVGDDSVVNKFTTSAEEEAALLKALPGRAVLDSEFYEVNDAALFHKQISESKKNNKYSASVFVYSVDEYKDSRLFLTADGKAGLAITKDGDIISVFSYGEGKGRVPQLIVNAIKEGAVSLDHYDTVLTNYYAKFGFKPVAKVKWNNEYAPDEWSKEVFKEFNKGEPDVVAMVYDGGNRNTIAERVGTFDEVSVELKKAPYVSEWDVAKELQSEFNKKVEKSPEFRMKGESLGVSQDETDTETMAILDSMNEMGAQVQAEQSEELSDIEARLEAGTNEMGKKLTVAQKSTLSQRADELRQQGRPRDTESKSTAIDVTELNERLDHPLPIISWKVVEGVPMIFNISDQLRTGDIVNPATGNTITNLKGGLGFTGVEGHQDMAWASVTKDKAQGQIDNATKVYNENKEYFTQWWKDNPQYKGLVPMAIVKMGQASILSNEAVVRVLGDNISSFPVARRKKAMTGFKRAVRQGIEKKQDAIKKGVGPTTAKQYEKWIGEARDVLQMINSVKPTTIDEILTVSALKKLKGITSVNVITDLIMTGKPNEVGKPKKKPGTASKLVSKILLGENPTAEQKARLNQGVVTDLLTEPQLEGVPQRSVFVIQGIDVLNPEILETNHPNYPIGPRGKTIGVLEQPQSVVELFPTVFNNVALGIAEEQRGGPQRSERKRLTQVVPVQAGMSNIEFVGAIGGIDQRESVLNFLNRSFPSVTLSVNTETFNNVMASEGVKEYLKGDEIVYGVTKNGDVYLNPDVHSTESSLYNTAVHEFGHVWTDYLQTTKKGREIYAKGAALVSKTAEYQNQLKSFKGTTDENGKVLTDEQVKTRAVNETMAILIGNKGETIIDASLKQQFQEWLVAVWTYVKDTFKMSKDLTPQEIENLTLDEFLGTALADIMSGKKLKISDAGIKKLNNPEAAFSKADSMTDIVSRGRAEGFSEASIRKVLMSRGYTSATIKANMAMNIDLFSESVVPFEFGNIEGGMSAGIRLFQSVQSEVSDFAAPTERRTGVRMSARERAQRISDLRETHPTLLDISDSALLRRFPRRGVQGETVTTQKTPGEVRSKALEVLRDNPVFQAQTEAIQMELVVAMDRALGITANRVVSKEIQAIRSTLTQRKRAVREVQAVKRQLRQFIRKNLPKSKTYSQADINKIVRSVERVNQDNYRVEVEKILQVVEKQRDTMRTAVLKKLLNDVSRGAQVTIDSRNKNKGKSLSPEGQAFSKQFKKVLILAMKSTDEESVKKFQELVSTLETDEALEAFAKDAAGESLTQKEQGYVNLAAAIDLVKNLDSMSLEEVQALANDYKIAASQSRQYLSEIRKERARKSDAIRQKILGAMRKSNPELFNENGTLKDTNETRAAMDSVRMYWKEGKGKGLSARVKGQVKAAKLYFETYKGRSVPKLIKSLVDSLKHLGTFLSSVNETVHEEIFNRLNKLDNNSLRGYFKEQDILSSLGYEAVQQGLFDTKMYKIEGLISTKNKTLYDSEFSKDQLLRFYALSLNPIQRRKLAAQGIDEEKMDGIKKHLGKEAIDFADKVVQYLSTEYYESVNDVYRDVNDANLSYVENYFPTMTTQSDVNAKQLFEGDFNGIFNAESAPALRNRTDMTSDIDLKAAAFSTALESHIKTMEHYKAYAADTKVLNTIVNTPSFDAALGMYGIKGMVKQSINNAINPDSGRNALSQTGKAFNILQTQFTAFALAFKAMQVVKQATSFINAFEHYSYRKGKRVGYGADLFIDILPFVADYTAVLLNARKYHKLFKDISPTYRYRVQQGVKGDLAALESGSPTRTGLGQATTKIGKAFRGFKRAGASPTIMGDLLGVMGYAANFRRDMKNGMSQEQAVAKFNEYNSTQQTRRASERSILQQNSNFLVRTFTMFGSTPILLINNVMQAMTSILKNGPTTQNTRRLVLNLGMANAAFVAMSNIGILMKGDDEERREVLRKIRNAALGLNLVYQAPFIGAAVKEVENWLTGNRRPTRGGVNPFISLVSKIQKAERDDNLLLGGLQVIGEIGIGAQIDPLIGLKDALMDIDEAGWNEAADILGISGSYRPESWEEDYVAPTAREMREEARKERRESRPSYIAREKRKEERKEREEERQR